MIPAAEWLVTRELVALGLTPTRRVTAMTSTPFITENGNIIIDCGVPEPALDAGSARTLQQLLRAIVGVVDTGFFLGTADTVLVGYADGHVDTLSRHHAELATR